MKKKQICRMCSLLFSAAVAATVFPTDAFAAEFPRITENTAKFALSAQIFNSEEDFESEYRDAEITTETALYQTKNWTVVNLTFESADASKTAKNLLRFKPVVGETDIVEIGTAYNSTQDKITTSLQEMAVGQDTVFCTKNDYAQPLPAGNGPIKATKKYYCLVSHDDESKSYYQINVLRKGYKGASGASQYETSPYGISNFDSARERFYMNTSYLFGSKPFTLGKIYDENGEEAGDLEWEKVPTDKNTDTIWFEDGWIYASRAGAMYLFKAAYNGEEFKIAVRAKYAKQDGKTLLDKRRTDGVRSLVDFATVEDFTGAFPEDQTENAKAFYELVQTLDGVLAANKSDMAEGGWDYLLYKEELWNDDCESAKLNRVMDLAPGVWENLYDRKAVKEAIQTYVDLDKYPLEQQAMLKAIIEKYINQIDSEYASGVIRSMNETHAILENAKAELDTVKIPLSACSISLDTTHFVYDGTEKEPLPQVTGPDKGILTAEEYTVTYENNIHAGEASATVTGTGVYTGTRTIAFTIGKASQTITTEKAEYACVAGDKAFSLNASVNSGKALHYDSSDSAVAGVSAEGIVTPLKEGNAVIMVRVDGDADYLEQTVTVKVQVSAKPEVKNPQNGSDKPEVKDPQNGSDKPDAKDPQNGSDKPAAQDPQDGSENKPQEQLLRITKSAYTKTEGNKAFSLGVKTARDVTVTYATSAKAVAVVNAAGKVTVKGPGRAIIRVTAKAKNGETKVESITVDVRPSAKLGLGIKSARKQLNITWKSNKKVTGYEIQVAADKKFKKVVKKVNIKKPKTGKTMVKKLKSGTKYYVKIRSYKKVKGKTLYSNWTKAKTGKPEA